MVLYMVKLVVTGLGAVTPIGNNVEDFWRNREGKIDIGPITKFDTTDYN